MRPARHLRRPPARRLTGRYALPPADNGPLVHQKHPGYPVSPPPPVLRQVARALWLPSPLQIKALISIETSGLEKVSTKMGVLEVVWRWVPLKSKRINSLLRGRINGFRYYVEGLMDFDTTW